MRDFRSPDRGEPQHMRLLIEPSAVAPKRGAAWLSLRTGVPMVPVAIGGSDLAMGRGDGRILRSKLQAAVAEPLFPDDFADRPDPVGAMIEVWQERVDAALARFQESQNEAE